MNGIGGENVRPAAKLQRREFRGADIAGSNHPLLATYDRLAIDPTVPELQGLRAGAINGYGITGHEMTGPVARGRDDSARAVIALHVRQDKEAGSYCSHPSVRHGVVTIGQRFTPHTDSPDVWITNTEGGRPLLFKPPEMESANGPEAAVALETLLRDGTIRFDPLGDPNHGAATWTLVDPRSVT